MSRLRRFVRYYRRARALWPDEGRRWAASFAAEHIQWVDWLPPDLRKLHV